MVFAGRLRDLHCRAFSQQFPDPVDREQHYDLRQQFLVGLAEPRLWTALMSSINREKTLNGLVQLADV